MSQPAHIRTLASEVINQIAAGEVVERPAGVLRELLDNAVDAGASQIDVEIANGGIDQLCVRDNGCGIAMAELPLALERHATSKIQELDDLEHLGTLGFRGEALPSIAAVADLELISRTADAEHAWRIAVGPGRQLEPATPARGGVGTQITMRDLFSRVPARRKFLRSPRTEWTHLESLARRMALSRPEIAFRLFHNGKSIWDRPAESLRARVEALVGADFVKQAMPIDAQDDGLRLRGFASQPAWSRVQPDTQFFFLNGRYLRDRLIVGALRAAYAEVLHGSRQPGYVLFLEVPADSVDVNVHPTKQEVRFRDSRTVFRFLRGVVLDAIRRPVAGGAATGVATDAAESAAGRAFAAASYAPSVAPAGAHSAGFVGEQRGVSFAGSMPLASSAPQRPPAADQQPVATPDTAGSAHQFTLAETPPLGFALGQLHQAYVIAQNDKGLVLVDMHAAHERIVLERLKAALADERVVAQPLLVPIELAASVREMAAMEEAADWLSQMGMDVRALGPERIGIFSRPRLLDNFDLERLLRDVLADLHAAEGADLHRMEAALDRALGNHACKAGSIKHGRVLTHPEMNALLRQIEETPRSGQCNHGRPTWRQIPLDELDGWFLRGR